MAAVVRTGLRLPSPLRERRPRSRPRRSAGAAVTTLLVLVGLVLSGAGAATGARAGPAPVGHGLRITSAPAGSSPPAKRSRPLPLASDPTWSIVGGLATAPSSRSDPSMTYDSELSVVVLFGGYSGSVYHDDTWEFSNGTWTNVTSLVGTAPPGRSGGVLADDPVDGYLVLWGGSDGSQAFSDTWAFNATGWHGLTTTSGTAPPSAYLASMAWDVADKYLVLEDGYNSGPTPETWKFIGGKWTELTNTGAGSPGVTEAGGMDYDAQVGAIVYYDDFPNTYGQDGTWEFSNGTWTDEGVVPTPARAWPGMTYDGIDGYSLLFGGNTWSTSPPHERNDTWALENGTWTNLTSTAGGAPSIRDSPGVAFDAADGYVVLFGGVEFTGSENIYFGDTWTYGIFGPGHPPTPTVTASANRTLSDVGLPVAFTAVPGSYGVPPFTFSWTFGDGSTGSGASVAHVYGAAAEYSVTVTITDSRGSHGAQTLTETVHPDPSVTFSSDRADADLGQTIDFNGSASNGTAPFLWNWTFGDGGRATAPVTTHVFTTVNSFTVQLVITDSLGVLATHRLIETVSAVPTVALAATPTVTDVGLPVAFVATPALGTAPYLFVWSFGDGATVSQPSASTVHAYTSAGTFPVDLMLHDQAGDAAWQNGSETVHPLPVATATVQAISPGTSAGARTSGNASVLFRFVVSVRGGTGPYAITWDLGDGTDASAWEVNHTYAQAGNYSSVVSVTDALGVSSHAYLNVSVVPTTRSTPPPAMPSTPPSSSAGLFGGALPYVVPGVLALAVVAGVLLWRRRRRPGTEDRSPEGSDGSIAPDDPGGDRSSDLPDS